MINRTERTIFCYDLIVSARAQHATAPSMDSIVSALSHAFSSGTFSHPRERGSVIFRIGDIRIDQGNSLCSMLLRRCDTNSANAVYSNRNTGTTRILRQMPDEGGDKAAHIVISTQADSSRPDCYLCHLEGVPGLSHRLVQSTLNAAIKAAIAGDANLFVYPDPAGARRRDGSPKVTPFIPTLELVGHPADHLLQDIENGHIHDITLVDQRVRGNLGGNRYLSEIEGRVRVKVDRNMPGAGRLSRIVAAAQSRVSDFQIARIRFRSPSGIDRTVECEISTGAIEQQSYIQSYRVSGISPPMDESSERLTLFLTEEMQSRVLSERS